MSSTKGGSTETDICLQMIETGKLFLKYNLEHFCKVDLDRLIGI